MGKYNFDEIIDRRGTSCEKWDEIETHFGKSDLISLWVADMDFKVPSEVIEILKKRVEHGIFGYTAYPDSWYESFISWTLKRHNWKLERDWITHSPGVITAMGLSIRAFTKPGDGILIQPPVYPHFEEEITLNERVPVLNPLIYKDGRFEMDMEDLERKLPGAKMMFLCSPHNPAGRVWSVEELRKVADLCVKHDVIIASDEIHADIVYSGNTHYPLGTISPDVAQRCAVFMAPSKTFNIAGLKASAIIIPNPELRAKYELEMNRVDLGMGGCMSIAGFEACYSHGEEWLDELIEYLEGNITFVEDFLAKHIPSVKLVKPEGTYIPFVDMKALGMNAEDLHSFLIEAGVAMNSGTSFGSGGEGFARLNIATPRANLKEGLERIEKAINS